METRALARILVVEDDPDIREILGYVLGEISGWAVESCERGDQVLGAARRFGPDLILMDAMLPGMDGPAVLRVLRQVPETAGIPVVFLTARTLPGDLEEYRAAGALRVIAKPFDLDGLPLELGRAWEEFSHAA